MFVFQCEAVIAENTDFVPVNRPGEGEQTYKPRGIEHRKLDQLKHAVYSLEICFALEPIDGPVGESKSSQS